MPANAPAEYQSREKLWNAVETSEKSKNAQLSREVEIALPVELSRTENIDLVRQFVQNNFISQGMCADIAIHEKHSKKHENPHAHIMLTMRPIDEQGRWAAKSKKEYILDADGNKQYDPIKRSYKCRKIRATSWDSNEFLHSYRQSWADILNAKLEQQGIPAGLNPQSYEEQGIEQIPTIHLGHKAHALEKMGIQTVRGNRNRLIREANKKQGDPLALISRGKALAIRYLAELRDKYADKRETLLAVQKDYDDNRSLLKRSKTALKAIETDLSNINTLKGKRREEQQSRAELKWWQVLDKNASLDRSLKLKKQIEELTAAFAEKRGFLPIEAETTIEKRRAYIIQVGNMVQKQAENIPQMEKELRGLKVQYQKALLLTKAEYNAENTAEITHAFPPIERRDTGTKSVKKALNSRAEELSIMRELHDDKDTGREAYSNYTDAQASHIEAYVKKQEQKQEKRSKQKRPRSQEWEPEM